MYYSYLLRLIQCDGKIRLAGSINNKGMLSEIPSSLLVRKYKF